MTASVVPIDNGAPGVVSRLLGFVRLARDNGFRLGIREGVDALIVAGESGLLSPQLMRATLKSLLCSCADDWRRFDALFDAYWLRRGMRQAVARRGRARVLSGVGDGRAARSPERAASPDTADAEGAGRRSGASSKELLARTDLRHLNDPHELAQVYELAERLAVRMRKRVTRRHRARARGRVVDMRTTIHRSLRSGGMPLDLAYRQRRERPIRLVTMLDASGSMSLYSTFFMRFVRGIVENFAEAEAFVFHTRLVHVSAVLRERDIEKAVDRMNVISAGWGGGTRLGACLETFNTNYAKTVLNSRTVVMIFSDGYDTGDPAALGRQLQALGRRARRIVWLNPLLGWPGYEPVAQGMAAALPHIDLFAPAHNLESLAALEPALCEL